MERMTLACFMPVEFHHGGIPQSDRGGVTKEVKVTHHKEFKAVPLLDCSLVSYHA